MSKYYKDHPYQQPDWQLVPACTCRVGRPDSSCAYTHPENENSVINEIYSKYEAETSTSFERDFEQ